MNAIMKVSLALVAALAVRVYGLAKMVSKSFADDQIIPLSELLQQPALLRFSSRANVKSTLTYRCPLT